jgi:hypothetical protein
MVAVYSHEMLVLTNQIHGVMTKKIKIHIFTAVNTSNLTIYNYLSTIHIYNGKCMERFFRLYKLFILQDFLLKDCILVVPIIQH